MASLLTINPPDCLSFGGSDFSNTQTKKLVIENNSDGNVAFKVKTTALKAYLVRPSSSVLKPGEKQEIAVMLQKLQEVPPNHQHRFLIQAVPTTETTIESKEAWQAMTEASKAQEYRLSVVFPDVNGSDAPATSGQSGGANYSQSGSGSNRDLQSKFNELADYTKALQERREELKKEVKKLEEAGATSKNGYQLKHILMAMFVVLVLSKLFERLALFGDGAKRGEL